MWAASPAPRGRRFPGKPDQDSTFTSAVSPTRRKRGRYGRTINGLVLVAVLWSCPPSRLRVSAETQTAIDAKKAEIVAGTFNEFQGPIVDQAGVEKVPAGETMAFGEQMSINWFVKGVDGEVPAS